jgi:hypothetical protein
MVNKKKNWKRTSYQDFFFGGGGGGFHYFLHEKYDFNLHEGFIIKNFPNFLYFGKKIQIARFVS